MSKESELCISISRKAVENSNGFSIDMGGSAVKLAYHHIDDWRELQKQGQDVQAAKIRLKVFAKDDLEEALEFLSKYCHINRENDECPVVNITGMGCNHLNQLIKKQLNVTTQIINEAKCFAGAFMELAGTLQQDDFEYTSTEERREELRPIMVRWSDLRAIATDGPDDERSALRHLRAKSWYMGSRMTAEKMNLPIDQALPEMYPALLYIVSSGSFFLMLKSDENYEICGANTNGGMIFLGLGNAICRSKKSYDELIDMAENGDYTAVDETIGVYKACGEEQQTDYSAMADTALFEDDTVYAFRKVISNPSAPHREEDMVLSLLKITVRYHAQVAVTTAESTGSTHVYLTGSFFNRQLVRKIFEEEFCQQIVFASKWNDEKGMDIEIHFVKTGGYLGSIGAFLNSSKSKPEN